MWNIKIYSRQDFITDVVEKAKTPVLAISISNPRDTPVDWTRNPNICGLSLAFRDVENALGMSLEDARKIAVFVFAHKDNYRDIAVNCVAGVSRSAGVAAAIMYYLTGSDDEIFESPKYLPNMRCYRYVLEALYAMEHQIARTHITNNI